MAHDNDQSDHEPSDDEQAYDDRSRKVQAVQDRRQAVWGALWMIESSKADLSRRQAQWDCIDLELRQHTYYFRTQAPRMSYESGTASDDKQNGRGKFSGKGKGVDEEKKAKSTLGGKKRLTANRRATGWPPLGSHDSSPTPAATVKPSARVVYTRDKFRMLVGDIATACGLNAHAHGDIADTLFTDGLSDVRDQRIERYNFDPDNFDPAQLPPFRKLPPDDPSLGNSLPRSQMSFRDRNAHTQRCVYIVVTDISEINRLKRLEQEELKRNKPAVFKKRVAKDMQEYKYATEESRLLGLQLLIEQFSLKFRPPTRRGPPAEVRKIVSEELQVLVQERFQVHQAGADLRTRKRPSADVWSTSLTSWDSSYVTKMRKSAKYLGSTEGLSMAGLPRCWSVSEVKKAIGDIRTGQATVSASASPPDALITDGSEAPESDTDHARAAKVGQKRKVDVWGDPITPSLEHEDSSSLDSSIQVGTASRRSTCKLRRGNLTLPACSKDKVPDEDLFDGPSDTPKPSFQTLESLLPSPAFNDSHGPGPLTTFTDSFIHHRASQPESCSASVVHPGSQTVDTRRVRDACKQLDCTQRDALERLMDMMKIKRSEDCVLAWDCDGDLAMLYSKCLGPQWPDVGAEMAACNLVCAFDVVMALTAAFLTNSILSAEASWCDQALFADLEGFMREKFISTEKDSMCAAMLCGDRDKQQTARTRARQAYAEWCQDPSSAARQHASLDTYVEGLAKKLCETLRPHITVLQQLAYMRSRSSLPSDWQDTFVTLMTPVVKETAVLRLKLREFAPPDHHLAFQWPETGALLDLKTMRPKQSSQHIDGQTVAFTLFPGVSIRYPDGDEDSVAPADVVNWTRQHIS